jgi:hypothetical protein
MKPIGRELITVRIEQLGVLDTVSEPLQKAVRTAVPQESELKDLLSGTWLGHPAAPTAHGRGDRGVDERPPSRPGRRRGD